MFLIGQTNAQYLVIPEGNNIPFQDTILYSVDPISGSCYSSGIDYDIDLDQDSISDIDFHLECYMGGMGSSSEISLTSFNDFSIHVDTGYIEHYQFHDSVGQTQDATRKKSVVRKYNLGDTIFSMQNLLDTAEILYHYSHGNYPSPCVYNNIDLFLGDTSYISFEKSNGNLYYLKIYLQAGFKLIYAKTNTQINENELLENVIFPNPATDVIHLNKSYDFIEIYSAQGTLLTDKNEPGTQKTIDISYLEKGFYIVVLKKDQSRYITKLLKI